MTKQTISQGIGNDASQPEDQDAAPLQCQSTEDGPTPPAEPRKRGRRLRTIAHVKGGLAHTIRELESGRLDPKEANALVYAYSALANVMTADVARDLAELREVLTGLQGPPALQQREALVLPASSGVSVDAEPVASDEPNGPGEPVQ